MSNLKLDSQPTTTTLTYDQWRTQALLSDPDWQPKFNKGLAPVGVKLWIKVEGQILLAVRTGYVSKPTDAPEYELADGYRGSGHVEWCIY